MRSLFLFITLIFVSQVNAQSSEPKTSKWHTFVEADMIFPSDREYNYFDTNNLWGRDVNLDETGSLTSFGVQGSYNYHFLKRFSIGALGGLQRFTSPSISMIKVISKNWLFLFHTF